MAKTKLVVLRAGSYGKKGDIISLDLPKGGLTARQKVLLKEYKTPVVVADEVALLKAEVVKLKAANKKLEAELEAATKPEK